MNPTTRTALALRINERFFYGWLMLLVGAIGIFASGPGQSFIFSVFLEPISADLNISQTSVSSAYAVATLVAAFALPYIGRSVDRYGMRAVFLCVAVLFGMAALAFSQVTQLVTLSLAFMALRLLGQGSLMLCSNNLVSQWFSRKRGFALGLMALGFGFSLAVYPPLAQWLMEQFGWRQAWVYLALFTWLLLIPIGWLLIQNKPEAIGLLPDGDQPDNSAKDEERESAAMDGADAGLTLQEALRTSAFWIISAGMFTLAMLVTALFFYQIPILASQGVSTQLAANVFPLTALVMVVFMPIHGYFLDRIPTPAMFAWCLLLLAGALIAMVFVKDLPTAIIYSVIFGLNNAALHAVYTYVWPRYFGRKHLGSIQGVAQTIGVVGASLGPLPFGIAYDLFATYSGVLMLFALQPLLCAILVVFVKPPVLRQ